MASFKNMFRLKPEVPSQKTKPKTKLKPEVLLKRLKQKLSYCQLK